MKTVVLATNNPGKMREFSAFFSELHIALISQAEFQPDSIEETGMTFVENALLKARHVAHATSHPVIADDSGLVVPFLNGAPGIYSARYAGGSADDKANNLKLLEALKHASDVQRQAYFYCAIVYLRHAEDPTPFIGLGQWSGEILNQPQGNSGFGYDPLFYVPSHHCSSAELPLDVKNNISHRGQALQQLKEQLTHA